MINFILVSILIIVFLYLMIILISFSSTDPSWLQIMWSGVVKNLGGITGARISDCLFFLFGILAYSVPIFVTVYLFKIFFKKISIFVLLRELIGIFVLLCICCLLIHLVFKNFFCFSSGGVIGHILYDWICLCNNVSHHVSLIFFLGIFAITLYYNKLFLVFLNVIKNYSFRFLSFNKIFFKKVYARIYFFRKFNDTAHMSSSIFFTKRIVPNSLMNLFFGKNLVVDSTTNKDKFEKLFKCRNKSFSKRPMCFFSIKNIVSKKITTIHKFYVNNMYYNNYYYNNTTINISDLHENSKDYVLQKKIPYNNKFRKKYNFISYIMYNFLYRRKLIFFNKQRRLNTDLVLGHSNISDYNKKKNINLVDRENILPDLKLLKTSPEESLISSIEEKQLSKLLEKKLLEYRILANVVNIISGPVVTRFELNLSAGMKSARISSLSRDLARSLSVVSVRVVDIIPGTSYVGLEIPKKTRKIVHLHDIIASKNFQSFNTPLALGLGKDVSGNSVVIDLKKMPHLLVSGTTGSGKSIGINSMIVSMLYKSSPEEVRFIMIDPKILELSVYSNIPHLLQEVITEIQDVDGVLKWCIQEMEQRYKLMANFGVKNLESYNIRIIELNSKGRLKKSNFFQKHNIDTIDSSDFLKKIPYIVIIIDEFSDLIIALGKKIEALIVCLTQKARAAGIHLILATQRPSVNVITGLIKANIPARIAFTVSSKVDSITIIDRLGAESLLGMGDMLYLSPHISIPIRIHGAFVQDEEISLVVNFWKNSSKMYD